MVGVVLFTPLVIPVRPPPAENPDSGKFENEGMIGESVLNALKDGAVLINYDRGEVVDAEALDKVLSSGKVRYAAIDADIFKNPDSGEITGPMAPYLDLEKKHSGKLELLPHAAADTEHVSRVEGAKQAVDQIFSVIQFKAVINLKGDLPDGYTDGGAKTVPGVGKVTKQRLSESADDAQFLAKMRKTTEEITAIWRALQTPLPTPLLKPDQKSCWPFRFLNIQQNVNAAIPAHPLFRLYCPAGN